MEAHLAGLWEWLKAHRRERLSLSLLVMAILLFLWLFGNVVSPYLAPPGTIDFGEGGLVGIRDNAGAIDGINSSFARFFYDMGDANCHQHASRSFFLNGNQMPFCSRCTAIFLGLGVGAALMVFLDVELNILWVILGLVPIGVDGCLQLVTKYESTNLIRFATGLLAGIVTGVALAFIVTEFGTMVANRRRG